MTKATNWLLDELPFVLFRNPNETEIRGVFQNDASLQIFKDLKTPGFVFVPFQSNGKKVLISGSYRKSEFDWTKVDKNERSVAFSDDGKDRHIELVEDAIRQIENGNLKKVVLSRYLNASTAKSPLQLFTALLLKYSTAFCYWWYHPKVGMWFGATPEQLLHYRDGKVSTTSLAGTLPVMKDEKPSWSAKEREEQQMVTDYILENLKGKLIDLNVSEPETHKAGKLWHLRSEINGKAYNFDDLLNIVESLHPTPAVCGLPKSEALEYIVQHEGYDREYYTGYLGTINLEEKDCVDLFVNLRCFKYSSGRAKVFVGGGITSDSNPKREWEETQYKCRTILEVL